VQFGVLDHARLHEQRRLRRIDAGGEPVDRHVAHVFLDHLRAVVVRGQRVPVGDEEQALVFVLQTQPVFQHAVVVAKVQAPGGAACRRERGRSTFFAFCVGREN